MSVLSKMPVVLGKLTELAGAGLASAAGAFLFAQLARPAAPPPPIVQIEPVQQELVRAVRSENAALIQELRKAEVAKEPDTPPRIASVAAPKPPKPNQVQASGRKPNADHGGIGVTDRKSERVSEADMMAPDAKALDIAAPTNGRAQPAAAASWFRFPPATRHRSRRLDLGHRSEPSTGRGDSLARTAEADSDIFRIAPSVAGAAPRPPMPVGELVSGDVAACSAGLNDGTWQWAAFKDRDRAARTPPR